MEIYGETEATGDIHMKIDSNHVYWEGEGECNIAIGTHIGPFSSIIIKEGLSINTGTIIGPSVTIVDHDHNIESKDINTVGNKEAILIGKYCWIGANAVILKGVRLPDYCVVGAGSVVVKGSYEKGSVFVGNPAKVIRMRPIYE
jgi:acetyltransferase-like isoleucine patch superfamily enzyme